jgi:hypothetical protein
MRYFTPPYEQRPSAGFQTIISPDENMNYHSFYGFNRHNIDIGNSYGQNSRSYLTIKQRKALEAHECFVKWITKLSSLVNMSEPEIMTGASIGGNSFGYFPY